MSQANFDYLDPWPLFHGLLAFENCGCLQYCAASRLWYHWVHHYWSDDYSSQWRRIDFSSGLHCCSVVYRSNRQFWYCLSKQNREVSTITTGMCTSSKDLQQADSDTSLKHWPFLCLSAQLERTLILLQSRLVIPQTLTPTVALFLP